MKTPAAVLRKSPVERPYAHTRPLSIETIDLAPPGPDELLVKIGAAGLCHSDLSVINGDRPRPVPMALGHEAAGTVEAVGSGVRDISPGDRVVMSFMPSCGHCLPCAEGRPALCVPGAEANGKGTLLSGERRLSCGEVPSITISASPDSPIMRWFPATPRSGSRRICRWWRRLCSAVRC
ncbi:Zn-dependent alcohol dehydrogenase [Sinorhizobium meliloti]|nr:Zn-dependent alcohol dehydrogenase [Sinorhizobium meliloti]GEC39840.1 hypothetical protein EME01_39120 [Sinorhizobium meliloti]